MPVTFVSAHAYILLDTAFQCYFFELEWPSDSAQQLRTSDRELVPPAQHKSIPHTTPPPCGSAGPKQLYMHALGGSIGCRIWNRFGPFILLYKAAVNKILCDTQSHAHSACTSDE